MKNIKNQIKALGITSQQLADDVGMDWSTIQRYRNGRLKPSKLILEYLRLRIWKKSIDGLSA